MKKKNRKYGKKEQKLRVAYKEGPNVQMKPK
jgi:hypothetical protein